MENNNKTTILIIDDSQEDRETVKRFLSKSGKFAYSFLEAETGKEGLELSKSHKPDCILLDFQLPDTDGISFIKAITEERKVNNIPVILLTGRGDERIATNALKSGAQDYLVKANLNTDILLRAIRYAIEKKHIERELREREERFRMIHDTSLDGIITANTKGKIIDTNQNTEKIFGYEAGEMVGLDIVELMPERFRKLHRNGMGRFLKTGKGKYLGTLLELEGLRKNGEIFPIELIVNSFTINENIYFTGTIRDITRRKLADEMLKKERQRLFSLLDGLPAFVYLQARDYSISFANRYFKEIFGDPKGKLCYQALHKRDKPCEECPTFSIFNTKVPQIREWDQAPNGRIYQVYDYPFTDTDGTLLVLELGIDITEKKLAQEQTNASLKEKEVLLKEIHHRVKNNMQVISSLLKLQARSIKDKNIVGVLEESQNRIKSMSLIHEELYQSKDFAHINFSEYIKNLVNNLFRSYKMSIARVALRIDVSDITIDIDSIIPCGLIVNELITNSLKYAFPDNKKGEIKISLHKNEDAEIKLVFSDNGIGIPEDLDCKNTDSLGLRLIFNMTEHQLGGKVELDRSEGTKFIIRFKEPKYKKRS